jgi:site-specific DNA-methyltransferase (adenine-specific)
MATMEPDSIDAIATDPPYGLGILNRQWDHDVPGVPFWVAAMRVAKPGAYLAAFGGTRKHHRLMVAIEDAGWELRDVLSWNYGSGFPHGRNGPWGGTALKPSWEPIILARKALDGSVDANFAAHGTGGLNIQGCRLQHTEILRAPQSDPAHRTHKLQAAVNVGSAEDYQAAQRESIRRTNELGRWPANTVLGCACDEEHDPDCAVALLDAQSGDNMTSRFYYTAKASRAEREDGLEHRARVKVNDGRETAIDNPFQRGETQRANTHPTVKPVELMRWIARLVTPKGGVVLDPFNGSGSTGCACVWEGFDYIGIELDAEHVETSKARIAAALEHAGKLTVDDIPDDLPDPVQLGLLA